MLTPNPLRIEKGQIICVWDFSKNFIDFCCECLFVLPSKSTLSLHPTLILILLDRTARLCEPIATYYIFEQDAKAFTLKIDGFCELSSSKVKFVVADRFASNLESMNQ